MTKEEKIKFSKQRFTMLEGLAKDIEQRMGYAKEGVREGNANLIIGSLSEETAQHLKNIYEAMLFMHRN
jgi:hypothetical protein